MLLTQPNIMTILNGNDDQMVPECCFDVVNSDSGGSVIQKQIPDLDSLLSDLQGFAEAEVQKQQLEQQPSPIPENPAEPQTAPQADDFMAAPLPAPIWESDAHSDMSFYDDYSMLKRIKMEVTEDMYPGSGVEEPRGQLPPVEDLLTAPQTMGVGGNLSGYGQHYDECLYDATIRKIEYACMAVGINRDPYSWTVDEVRRWASWAVDQYSGLGHDLGHLLPFEMDGTTLCMLTKQDFVVRSPSVGEYLYAELEIWKNAYSLLTVPVNPASVESSPEQELSYLDLDQLNQSTSSLTNCNNMPAGYVLSDGSGMASQLMTSQPSMVDMERVLPHLNNGSPTPSLGSTGSCANSPNSWSSPLRQDVEIKQEIKEEVAYRTHAHHGKQATHLWQFLKELLLQPNSFQGCIRWLDRAKGIFKIEDSARVAKLWGQRKNRPAMNYDKLSRSIRQYYKKGIIKKTTNSKRLVYQFCPQYL